jgi:hypothetical protein
MYSDDGAMLSVKMLGKDGWAEAKAPVFAIAPSFPEASAIVSNIISTTIDATRLNYTMTGP